MSTELLESVFEIIFGGTLLYLSPLLFLLMVISLADKFIGLIYNVVFDENRRRWRS